MRSNDYDKSTIVYYVKEGKVYGGSDSKRIVHPSMVNEYTGYHYGGVFAMELDLSERTFIIEIDDERFMIDANIGDFEYSPILILENGDLGGVSLLHFSRDVLQVWWN